MKQLSIVTFVVALILLSQSCGKKPYPCFSTNPDEDNIHVGQPIVFSAYCTTNGQDYFWEFYDTDDSIEFGPIVTKYFKDTGEVKVSLDATNGNKSARYVGSIYVKP